jgi:ubiquinol-cytochrome c reductase cytochrome b subunit
LPGVLFTVLYLAPFIEARKNKDRAEHHLLDRPRDRPVRTAIGVSALVFYLVLLGSASGDVLSTSFGLSVNAVIWMGRIALVVLPLTTYHITKRLCVELQRRDTAATAAVSAPPA